MVHKKVLGKRLSVQVERMSRMRLMVLLSFILAVLSTKKGLTKKQKKSLAITENQLGIRKKVLREEKETRPRKKTKKGRGKHREKARHLQPGVHEVNIRGKRRKVRVLANGRWQFMKG